VQQAMQRGVQRGMHAQPQGLQVMLTFQ
jgi:hypothetical protein